MNAMTRATSSGSPPRASKGTTAPRSLRFSGSCSANCSVMIAPGPTAFTRIPNGPRSSAAARVNASTPPFVASYAAMLRCARAPPNEVRFTTLPPFRCSTMRFAARCVQRYTLRRFDRTTSSQCWASIARRWAFGSDHAALFTSTSTVPNARSVSSNSRPTSRSSPTSAATAIASWPSPSIASTIGASRPRSVRPWTTIRAPSAARRRAVAFPMPRLEPVTIATLPSRRIRVPARRGRRDLEPLEDRAELGALVERKLAERRSHPTGAVTEQLHRGLHDRDLEPAPPLAQVVERAHGALVETSEVAELAAAGEAVELERRLGPEAGQRGGEPLGAGREVRPDHVVARAGEPDEPLRAEPVAHVLAQPLEQPHVPAAVLERDEVRDLPREPLELRRRERHAVTRVDRDAEARRRGDVPVIGVETLAVGVRVVRRQHEDAVRAGPLGAAREVRGHAWPEAHAGDHRHATVGRLDRGGDRRGALVGGEAEQLARAARRDERVHPAGGEPARVRADGVEVDRSVAGIRGDREGEDAAQRRPERRGLARDERAGHRRTRTTMFVGLTNRSAASSSATLIATYTTAIASICWLGRMPGANAA